MSQKTAAFLMTLCIVIVALVLVFALKVNIDQQIVSGTATAQANSTATVIPATATAAAAMQTQSAQSSWPTGNSTRCDAPIVLHNLPTQEMWVVAEAEFRNVAHLIPLTFKKSGETTVTFVPGLPIGNWDIDLIAVPQDTNLGDKALADLPPGAMVGYHAYYITC